MDDRTKPEPVSPTDLPVPTADETAEAATTVEATLPGEAVAETPAPAPMVKPVYKALAKTSLHAIVGLAQIALAIYLFASEATPWWFGLIAAFLGISAISHLSRVVVAVVHREKSPT